MPPNGGTANVIVSIVDDAIFEQTEQFQVDITAGDNNVLGTITSMTVTINDDDECKLILLIRMMKNILCKHFVVSTTILFMHT